jgi:hypothetical protein
MMHEAAGRSRPAAVTKTVFYVVGVRLRDILFVSEMVSGEFKE